MKEIDLKKSPGLDLITGKIPRELSVKCYKLITFVSILGINHFPSTWKVAQIIVILVFEKLIIDEKKIIPKHGTIERVHRLVNYLNATFSSS